jgi:hypothetical protein
LHAFEPKHIQDHLTKILEDLLLFVKDEDTLVDEGVYHLDDPHLFKIFAVTCGHIVKDSLVYLLLLPHPIVFVLARGYK